ncbi:MAG: glycosyltransferase family 2 protein [Daejeonella sp.]
MSKSVALILLNWNTSDHIIACVTSLEKYCDRQNFDIIIADNGSTDESVSKLQLRFPDHIYINNKENLGFAEGNNRAMQYSIDQGYIYSLLLNPDTTVEQDIVSALLNYLNDNSNAIAVQPAIYWLHQPDKLWNGAMYFNSFLGITYSKRTVKKEANSVDWLSGCCFLIRNEALKTTGLFNKEFFMYYEDVDLSFRLRQKSFELHYLSSCKVFHEAGVAGKLLKKSKEGTLNPVIHYYICRNKIWFLRRYSNPIFYPFVILYNSAYYSSLLFYLMIRRRWKKLNYVLKGLKDGIITPQIKIWKN